MGEILLIKAKNEANNGLLASFPTKSSEISTRFLLVIRLVQRVLLCKYSPKKLQGSY